MNLGQRSGWKQLSLMVQVQVQIPGMFNLRWVEQAGSHLVWIKLPEQSCGGGEEGTETGKRSIKTGGGKWCRFQGGDRMQICGMLLLSSPKTRGGKSLAALWWLIHAWWPLLKPTAGNREGGGTFLPPLLLESDHRMQWRPAGLRRAQEQQAWLPKSGLCKNKEPV